MEIEKFKLILSLTHPDYELQVFEDFDLPTAWIGMRDLKSGESITAELLNGNCYKFSASAEDSDKAMMKVIEMWNNRNNK